MASEVAPVEVNAAVVVSPTTSNVPPISALLVDSTVVNRPVDAVVSPIVVPFIEPPSISADELSILATRVPTVMSISPLVPLVAVVLPTVNLSTLSSQPINILPEVPRFIKIPESLTGAPVNPDVNIIKLSLISRLVVFIDVVVPFTVKSPEIVTFVLDNVPSTDNPVNVPTLVIAVWAASVTVAAVPVTLPAIGSVTVSPVNVPTLVIAGWAASVTVAAVPVTLPAMGFAVVIVPFTVKPFLIIDVPVPSTNNRPFIEISLATKRRLFIDTSSLKSTDALVLLIRSVSPSIAVGGILPLAGVPVNPL